MSLILDGSNGLSDVDGSAATPAIRGTDANTGIFFPAADTIAFSEGGAEAMRIDSSGNLGIGTSSPATYDAKLAVFNGNLALTTTTNKLYLYYNSSTNNANLSTASDGSITFVNGTSSPTERMRIIPSGNLLVNRTTSANYGGQLQVGFDNSVANGIIVKASSTTYVGSSVIFENSTGGISGIISNTATTTAYGTSSDYRLKDNVVPMVGTLDKIALLKPVTYTWKHDNSVGQGFIAHELQEIFPDAVIGEKDAVNKDGSIKAQGIDTSFLVATLTAAIQELKATVDAQAAQIAALEAAV
jgi:hypothetical protein